MSAKSEQPIRLWADTPAEKRYPLAVLQKLVRRAQRKNAGEYLGDRRKKLERLLELYHRPVCQAAVLPLFGALRVGGIPTECYVPCKRAIAPNESFCFAHGGKRVGSYYLSQNQMLDAIRRRGRLIDAIASIRARSNDLILHTVMRLNEMDAQESLLIAKLEALSDRVQEARNER